MLLCILAPLTMSLGLLVLLRIPLRHQDPLWTSLHLLALLRMSPFCFALQKTPVQPHLTMSICLSSCSVSDVTMPCCYNLDVHLSTSKKDVNLILAPLWMSFRPLLQSVHYCHFLLCREFHSPLPFGLQGGRHPTTRLFGERCLPFYYTLNFDSPAGFAVATIL
ncbi:uncharacterized [Tachysurus ichikawai]